MYVEIPSAGHSFTNPGAPIYKHGACIQRLVGHRFDVTAPQPHPDRYHLPVKQTLPTYLNTVWNKYIHMYLNMHRNPWEWTGCSTC